jgi:hypothetical protein
MLSCSRSTSNPFILPSRSIDVPPPPPPTSEYTELMADEGSGVPICPCRRPMAKDNAEYVEDEADSGLLARPSPMVKLSDREW